MCINLGSRPGPGLSKLSTPIERGSFGSVCLCVARTLDPFGLGDILSCSGIPSATARREYQVGFEGKTRQAGQGQDGC